MSGAEMYAGYGTLTDCRCCLRYSSENRTVAASYLSYICFSVTAHQRITTNTTISNVVVVVVVASSSSSSSSSSLSSSSTLQNKDLEKPDATAERSAKDNWSLGTNTPDCHSNISGMGTVLI
ncbi:hypothetical protein E2C01_022756 [Portunus trituberculatus]|uniref:Uncharacterized protein n=1 Tax=Portunus trituberculatus TaxID=210409 RepID=A0A5B7E839_PORTR|nr:hypothetical protein [Portunus trituberculatus]